MICLLAYGETLSGRGNILGLVFGEDMESLDWKWSCECRANILCMGVGVLSSGGA